MIRPDKIQVLLAGQPPAEWASLRRTYGVYVEALEAAGFRVVRDGPHEAQTVEGVDAVVGFWGPRAWDPATPAEVARLACLHGGATLNWQHLPALLAALRDTDAVICNCRSDVAAIRASVAGRTPALEVLPLPVDPGRFFPLSKEEARKALDIDQEGLVLGFAGRLLPQKGLHYFLQVLDHCRHRLPGRSVGLVVGDFWPDYTALNPLGHHYREYVAGLLYSRNLDRYVRFLPGNLDDRSMREFYGAVDVLIHPTTSVDENFGYVPLEALACGRPAVATAYGGLKDTIAVATEPLAAATWVTDIGTRFDLRGLTLTTMAVLSNPAYASSTVQAGAAFVASELSFDVFVRRLAEAVTSAVERTRSGQGQLGHHPRKARNSAHAGGVLTWQDVQRPVEHYVSASAEDMVAGTSVFRWEGTWDVAERVYAVHDAAWPSRVQLGVSDARRLTEVPALGWWHPSAEELKLDDVDRLHGFQDLVRRGVLGWSVVP